MNNQLSAKPGRLSGAGSKGILAASFCLPFLLMGLSFALFGVYPFGDLQIIRHDFYFQYYPFIRELYTKMTEGTSLFWSWNIGLGVNFLSMYFYYLSSPLNLLIGIVPLAHLREVVSLFVLIRIGLAGLFCAYMLRALFGRADFSLIFFSACYALCGFVTAYYTNTMWLDSVALLPLVVLGTVRLLREKRFLLYTVTLFLAIWCNFLIGLYICIFTVLVFICVCALDRVSPAEFGRRLLRIAAYSLLAIGMTAALSIPTVLTLQNGYRTINTFPESNEWFDSFVHVIGNLAPMVDATPIKGLPNVYSGLLPVMLLACFVTVKKIRPVEKILGVAIVVFLLVSGNSTQLYYIWNAFNTTFSFPFRISFLLSFTLAVIAFRTLQQMGRPSVLSIIAMAATGGLVALCAAVGPQAQRALWACLIFTAVYAAVMLLYRRKILKRRNFLAVLLLIVSVELTLTAYTSLSAVGFSRRKVYPIQEEKVASLLERMREMDTEPFYRVETDKEYGIHNDPALLNYHGISNFASTVNVNVSRFLKGLGLDSKPDKNIYRCEGTTPLASTYLAQKYLVSRTNNQADTEVYWHEVADEVDVRLYESSAYLPLGFMVDAGAIAYSPNETDWVASQNDLFSLTTGLSGTLLTPVPVQMRISGEGPEITSGQDRPVAFDVTIIDDERPTITWAFTLPEDGLYFMDVNATGGESVIIETGERSIAQMIERSYFHPLGSLDADREITITTRLKESGTGSADITLYRFDTALYDEGLALLGEDCMTITRFESTYLEGEITASRDGLLYTSIPYEKGWRAYVDGEEAAITPIDDAMLCVPLTQGTHQLRLTYQPDGFADGVPISTVSLLAFIACVAVRRYKNRRARTAERAQPEAK